MSWTDSVMNWLSDYGDYVFSGVLGGIGFGLIIYLSYLFLTEEGNHDDFGS